MTDPSPQGPRAHHLEVPRTARYYTVGGEGPDPPIRAVWLALHGYGQLAAYFVRPFAAHAAGRLVVAPEALSRFYLPAPNGGPGGAHGTARVGATWMTREDRVAEIGDYVRYLDRAVDAAAASAGLDPGALGSPVSGGPALGVLGFSQGTATACRWAAHRHASGRTGPTRLVLWGGTVPPDLDLAGAAGNALRATRLTLVVGDADEYATPAVLEAEEARLRDANVPHDVVRYAAGHRLDDATLGVVLGS